MTNVGGLVDACVPYNIFNLFPLSVGGCTIAMASLITWFKTEVDTLILFCSLTSLIISNNLLTLCPVFADMNMIGAYDK